MAAKDNVEANGCTLQWRLENISYCCLNYQDAIKSPDFIAEAPGGTKWCLSLYPMGYLDKNSVNLSLFRKSDCSGPKEITVNCKLALQDTKGSFLKEMTTKHKFQRGSAQWVLNEDRRKVFLSDKKTFLSDDTLIVQCSIWEKGETLFKPYELYARTVWKVHRRSFVWKIHNFSTLQTVAKTKFEDDCMDFELVFKEGLQFLKNLVIDVISFSQNIKYVSFKTAILNSEGKKEYFGNHEYFRADLKQGILTTLISSQMLLVNKSRYLPNDVLSLEVEYLYSKGIVLSQFCNYGTISPTGTKNADEGSKEHFVEQPNFHLKPAQSNDLKSMYYDGIFSDMELRTSTQTFPVHKGILSARSSVFKKMFSIDMKETNCGHIDITDLDDTTVHRMLLYIYSDSLEDMQLENACKLYVAADKYEILSLRSRCSSFLKDNMCTNKAIDILALADRHKDDNLKYAVQDFILRHDEVYGSQEWKLLMATNLQLAADIMYRKIFTG